MSPKSVLVFAFLVAAGVSGCAPRFTSDPVIIQEETVSPEAEATLAEAGVAYQAGVDFFVSGQYDSAQHYLDGAVISLGRDVDWSGSGTALSERRLLLYKCRYFLDRMPPAPVETPEDILADVKPLKPVLPPIEVVDNEKVQKWIRYFSHDVRSHFQQWIGRSAKYGPMTRRILREEGMPIELTNLAMIESGFNPNAYSRAHAAGIWQFIKGTGKLYGLRIDSYVDERRDPAKSCRAAARHLRDLYEMFNDWPLAMAAYNTGSRNVEKAIARSRTTDYWQLSLKRETRDYVPMFMAAAIIMSDLDKYGFIPAAEDPWEFDEVEIPGKTSLKAVARACGVEPAVIAEMNPHLLKQCTPEGKPCIVRVPDGKAEICQAEIVRIPEAEKVVRVAHSESAAPAEGGNHTVRRGETLSKIAANHGTSVEALAAANGIKDYHHVTAGQVLVVPAEGYRAPASSGNPGIHTVRRGDTLSAISEKYGIRLTDLLAWNDLKSSDLLHPGQKLIVESSGAERDRVIVHKVRRGDTIKAIAAKYGASTSTVLKTNGLRATDKIFPGQRIKVPVRANT